MENGILISTLSVLVYVEFGATFPFNGGELIYASITCGCSYICAVTNN